MRVHADRHAAVRAWRGPRELLSRWCELPYGMRVNPAGDDLVKHRVGAPPGFFEWEAAGLRWLAAATEAGGAAVVTIRRVGAESIVLRPGGTVTATRTAAEAFGHALAATHASRCGCLRRGSARLVR